jgi:hypothetical protein
MAQRKKLISPARTLAELSNEEVGLRIRELRDEESQLREQFNVSIISQLAMVGSARILPRALLENAKDTASRAADVRIALLETSSSIEIAKGCCCNRVSANCQCYFCANASLDRFEWFFISGSDIS